jgi:hypothetical protein
MGVRCHEYQADAPIAATRKRPRVLARARSGVNNAIVKTTRGKKR